MSAISPKRILLFGDDGYDIVSEQLVRAFRDLGHHAERFYCRTVPSSAARFLYKFSIRSPLEAESIKLQYRYREDIGKIYMEKIADYKPDLVFIVHFNSITPDQIRKIREQWKIPVAWWLMADPMMVNRFDPFHIDFYTNPSFVFVADESWIQSIRLVRDEPILYLPFAADPRLYFPMELKKKYDIAIVANFASDSPTTIHKGYILERLCREGFTVRAVTKGIKRLFGSFPNLAKLDIVDDFYLPPQVNELYNQSKIVLGVNNPQAKSDPAVRVMEIAASGNFQLAEYRENTKPLMGDTVVEFNDLDDLVRKARFFLSREAERKHLAERSRDRVLERHTVTERAKKIVETVF